MLDAGGSKDKKKILYSVKTLVTFITFLAIISKNPSLMPVSDSFVETSHGLCLFKGHIIYQ